MGVRRKARESALQVLYGVDFDHAPSEAVVERYWLLFETPSDIRSFAEKLVEGVIEHKDDIDETIRHASKNWRLERMAVVDRNVLRIATYELVYMNDIPAKVSLNEAIEVGKRYGAEESASFINGILDHICSGVA